MLKRTHEIAQMKIAYLNQHDPFFGFQSFLTFLRAPTFVKPFSSKGMLSHILGQRQDTHQHLLNLSVLRVCYTTF